MEQRVGPQWPGRGDEVEVGHAAPEQRMVIAEVVSHVKAVDERGDAYARLVDGEQVSGEVAQRAYPFVLPLRGTLRHRVPQRAGVCGVPLGVVCVEQRVG